MLQSCHLSLSSRPRPHASCNLVPTHPGLCPTISPRFLPVTSPMFRDKHRVLRLRAHAPQTGTATDHLAIRLVFFPPLLFLACGPRSPVQVTRPAFLGDYSTLPSLAITGAPLDPDALDRYATTLIDPSPSPAPDVTITIYFDQNNFC